MEFKYRAGEQRGRASSSPTNHYYSSSASIPYFTQRRFEVGIDDGSLSNGQTNIPSKYLLKKIREERMIEERLANEMAQNRMIEEELLAREIARRRMLEEEMLAREIARRRMLEEEMFAKEIARKRMLEEEILREMEYLNHLPMNNVKEGDCGFDQRLEHGFEESPFNNRSIKYDDVNGAIGGSDELKLVESGNLESTIHSGREMPRVSPDMKFPASKKKRKASSSLPLTAKEGWNCSLCSVTTTSKKDFNSHIKGRKHRTEEARLRETKATPSVNLNADFSVEEDCAIDKAPKKGKTHQYSDKAGWWCKLCQVKCDTEAMLRFHLAGKKHKARFEAHNVKNGEVVVANGVDEGGERDEEDVRVH